MSVTAFNRRRRELAAKLAEEQKEQEPQQEQKLIDKMTVAELEELAKEKGIEGYENMKKAELIATLAALVVKDNDAGSGTGGDKA